MDLIIFFSALLCSYILGSLPFGLWVGLICRGVDIRTLGSKNIGATNVLRILGPGLGITVFVLDTLKGAAFIWIYSLVFKEIMGNEPHFGFKAVIGVAAIIGHTFSVFLNFKGGKGVATTLGVLIGLSPLVAACGFGTWLVVVLITRYVSLGSLLAGVSLPIAAAIIEKDETERIWMVSLFILVVIFVAIKHQANIQRLMAGTEPKFGKKKEESEANQQ